MPRKPASPKTETAKKTTRKKKATVEAVAETTPITAAEVVESVAETAAVDAPAVKVPAKKRGRKPAVLWQLHGKGKGKRRKQAEHQPVVKAHLHRVHQSHECEQDFYADRKREFHAYIITHNRHTVTDVSVSLCMS